MVLGFGKNGRYAFTEYTAPARWFVSMNYVVHSAMYSYYALKAMHYRVPRFISMVITAAQLAQMVAGCAVNLWAYQVSTSWLLLPVPLTLRSRCHSTRRRFMT